MDPEQAQLLLTGGPAGIRRWNAAVEEPDRAPGRSRARTRQYIWVSPDGLPTG